MEQAANTIAFILKKNIRRNNPVFNPLITSLFTTYGRPFTNNALVGFLSLELFTEPQKTFHLQMMHFRHTFFAHTNTTANKTKDHGPLLHVGYTFAGNHPPKGFTTCLQLQREHLRIMGRYLVSIHRVIQGRMLLKLQQCEPLKPATNGEYVLNVYDKAKPIWLTRDEAKKLCPSDAQEINVIEPPR
jgi:hypothetical protein